MKLDLIRPDELTQADVDCWLRLANTSSFGDSPFLHPDYVQAIARFRPQVEVAVLRENDESVGFFAYERHPFRTARPLGIKLADFQGVISADDYHFAFDEFLEEARLTCCHFDHWVPGQLSAGLAFNESASPYVQLADGYEAFISSRRASGSQSVGQTLRKTRKLERAVGPITMTWHDSDPLALESLWNWKAAQRSRSGTFDVLQIPWTRAFLQSLIDRQADGVKCAVATLRINSRIIAVHLGIHTENVMHYWFPAYDIEFAKYSPGSILLLKLAEESARRGIQRIDLGKGDDRYKASFGSGHTNVASGTADRNRMRRVARSSLLSIKTWVESSSLRNLARVPKRIIRRRFLQKTMRVQ